MVATAYPRTLRRGLLRPVGLLALVSVLVGLGPCGRMPGGMLWGGTSEQPVSDWSFTAEHDTCAVEVRHRDPYSVTAACFPAGAQLYVGCMNCPGKDWSAYALEDDVARVRLGDTIYPVTITRIADTGRREAAWRARHDRFGRGDPTAVPESWWLFALDWRDPGAS